MAANHQHCHAVPAVISVLKIALQYLSEGSGSVVTPGDLFEGLERTTVFVTGLDADIGAHSENPQPDTVANDSRTRRSTTVSSDSGAASAASAPEQTGWESDPESEESESEDEDSKAEEGDELLVAGERSSWDVVLHTLKAVISQRTCAHGLYYLIISYL